MFRMTLGMFAVALLLSATGCQMCCHPYDYSGPVYSDGCQCSGGARAGSIFAGGGVTSTGTVPPDGQVKRGVKKQISDEPSSYVSERPKTKVSRPAPVIDSGENWSPTVGSAVKYKRQASVGRPAKVAESGENWSPEVAAAVKSQRPGYVPGSERIISVTERVVKPAGDSSQSGEQLADKSGPSTSESMPSSGWTARRPTPEVLR